jgi:hypothetical protein
MQSNFLRRHVLLTMGLASTFVLFASEVSDRVWLARARTETRYDNLVATTTSLSTEGLVPRPDVKAQIEKIISAPAGRYHTIVGNHETVLWPASDDTNCFSRDAANGLFSE